MTEPSNPSSWKCRGKRYSSRFSMLTLSLHILGYKLLQSLKPAQGWRASTVVRQIASIIVFGGFAFAAFIAARGTTEYLLTSARLGLFLLHRYLAMLLFVFFLSVNIGNFIVSYASLYRSQETMFYLTKPISYTWLFLIKFIDNFFYSSIAFFLIAFAVLAGYGSHFQMPWEFFFHTMLSHLLPYMLLSAALAAMLLLLIMRFAPSIGFPRMMMLLVILYLGVLYGYFAFTNPIELQASVSAYYPRVDEYFGHLDPWFAHLLPNYWIADSLYWITRGDWSHATSHSILLISVTTISLVVMTLAGRKYFFSSWISSLKPRKAEESRLSLLARFHLTRPSLGGNSQSSVLLKKELWQFVREPSQWIHLGIVASLIITYLVSIATIDLQQSHPFLQTVSYLVLLLFNSFLVASISLRFVFPLISVEGNSFWSILSAPLSRSRIFWLKFGISLIPILVLSQLLVGVSHLSLTEYPRLLPIATLTMLSGTFALVALNLGSGSYFADIREKNPIRVASSQNATLIFLVCLVYLVVTNAIHFVPLNDYFTSVLRGVPLDAGWMLASTVAVLGISLAVGIVSVLLGLRAIQRDF